MHIVVISQFFWPDLSGASQLATDLVRELVRRGVKVTVVAGESSTGGDNDTEPPAAEIVRVSEFRFARNSLIRTLSYLSFFALVLGCLPRLREADLIITLTNPPLLPFVGTIFQSLTRARHVIWEMDMYPDLAVDLGVLVPGSLVTRLSGALIDFSRRRAQYIISLGPCMTRRLLARGTPENKIRLAESWADGELYKPASRRTPSGRVTVLYAGNMGLAHDFDSISAAMMELKADPRFHFSFIGDGCRMDALKKFCESHGVSNAHFGSFKPPRRLVAEDFTTASVGLVTQNSACSGTVVPSKIYGLLAAGLPVIFIGPGNATPALTIKQFQCGWHIECGRGEELVSLLRIQADNPRLVSEAGARARRAFQDHFALPLGVDRICRILGVATTIGPNRVSVPGVEITHD